MRATHLIAAAACAAATVVAAAPAHAAPDPVADQIDTVFTKSVREAGLRISAAEAIDVAHSTCDVLSRGGTTEDALRHVQTKTGWKSAQDIGTLGSLAVRAYCPGSLPKAP